MCYLVVVAATHIWINGSNVLVTACKYRCPSDLRKIETHFVDFDSYCPAQYEERKKDGPRFSRNGS